MEQLTLKELAPYLPYGLEGYTYFKYQPPDTFKKHKIQLYRLGMSDKPASSGEHYLIINEYITLHKQVFEPLLRPLYQLTEEIEHNGERFVPYKRLEWELSHNDCGLGRYLSFGDSHSGTVNVLDYYGDLQKLLEWHFNVFDIPKSLYLPIPSLNS